MRRSKSSSNIPLPVFQRTLSSENLRNSQTGLKRTNSSHNLAPPRPPSHRVSSKHHDGRPTQVGSACKPGTSKRTTATPLRMGPMGPRIASPGLQLTSQKINEKQYSTEQFRKVCSFLESRMDNFDPKYVKSLTLNSFVSILTLLFQEIDPRITINMENHKEIAMKYLKLYKYPGQVTVSMLKSANTSMSWAPVMSIFGWLVDIINRSNETDFEENKLKQYMAFQFKKLFRPQVQIPDNLIDEITGFNREKNNALEAELRELRIKVKAQEENLSMLKKREEAEKKQLAQMVSEIEEFKEGKLEIKLKNEIEQLKAEAETKEVKVSDLKLELYEISEIIAKQKYSLKDKEALLKELEDKEYSLSLKKTELETVLKLKYEYDTKQTDYRREIETEIHKINARLLQQNSVSLDAGAKKIRLPDRGFHQPEFLQIVKDIKRSLQLVEEKTNSKLNQTKETLVAVKNEFESTNENLNKLSKENTSFRNEIEKLNKDKERIIFEANIISKQLEKRIASLEVFDIKALEKQEIELNKELLELRKKVEDYKEHCLQTFKEIRRSAQETGKELYGIMKEITDAAASAHADVMKMRETVLDELFTKMNYKP